VGVVLSGGGARGLAHVGALQALEHCGVSVDLIAGTSIGAAVAGQWAMSLDIQGLLEIAQDFSRSFGKRFLRDLTFPAVSLNSARRFSAYLKEAFADVCIEDLWIPYFCNSSNLSTAEVAIHQEGLLWPCIRASCSIPGIWPPVILGGNMLVDGGVMNNLPADVMRTRCAGSIIAIDVSPTVDLTVPREAAAEFSGWAMLWKRLNPFSDKVDMPHIFNILSRTSQLGSIRTGEVTRQIADLYIQLPTKTVEFFDWKAAHKLIDVAYGYCRNEIEQWKR
jgi:predicted acylesterase/phospholipase RssA